MSYTDLELRDATQIAYLDLWDGFKELENDDKIPPFTIEQIIEATNNKKVKSDLLSYIEGAGMSVNLNEWKINMVHDMNSTIGFYACVIETSEKEAIVAFRGSESGKGKEEQFEFDWIMADFGLVNSTQTIQQWK